MASAASITEVDQGAIAEVCRKHNVTWLAVFGSVARDEAHADSDVDVLIEFEPDAGITYVALEDLADDLSPLFGGRYVDIGRPGQLHWLIRDRVLQEARVLYAR